jgi:acetolactate synthase-1/2/3 large subunit
MNGAESLSHTLVGGSVSTCFINPGTTEIRLVTAMANEPGMRTILCLFEGVCTGAADGYARMTGKPAATILHLGPGLANGLANLHNAKRANSPILNIVGDHATYHGQYDAPLTSDIMSVAKTVSSWFRSSINAGRLAQDGAEAIQASLTPPGRVVALVVPADCAWGQAHGSATVEAQLAPAIVSEDRVRRTAEALQSGRRALMLIGGQALSAEGLETVGRIADKTGADVVFDTFSARLARGAGRFPVQRLPYFPEKIIAKLADLGHLILVGAKAPVAFFASQEYPSWLTPADCKIHSLAGAPENALDALDALADRVEAKKTRGKASALSRPGLPTGALTAETAGMTIGALLPEDAVVSDESITSGGAAFAMTTNAPPHDWLFLTGGSMGQGLPVATGAAVACPDRKVICLHGDGGAMYTLQSLWTQARESLDVTTIIFSNRKYKILQEELLRAGLKEPGSRVLSMLDLSNPNLDWVKLAAGMGVHAGRAERAEEFNRLFAAAVAEPGPHLIEAVI